MINDRLLHRYLNRMLPIIIPSFMVYWTLFVPLENLAQKQVSQANLMAIRLQNELVEIFELYQAKGIGQSLEMARQKGIYTRDGKIKVIADFKDQAPSLHEFSNLGVVQDNLFMVWRNLVQMLVPIQKLPELAKFPNLMWVHIPKPPERFYDVKDISSEGESIIEADNYRNLGFKGQGVKVAVLDYAFPDLDKLRAKVKDGMTPRITTKSFYNDINGNGNINGDGDNHGTAVAEIVFDVAPMAQLYLINFQSVLEFQAAVAYAIDQDMDIIACSLGWFSQSYYDGTGPISNAVLNARINGILWVNAAGNDANHHYEGTFQDDNNNGFHEFTAGDETIEIDAAEGDNIVLYLNWNDWPYSTNDYDLMLRYQPSDSLVARGNTRQQGGQPPFEEIRYKAKLAGTYQIKIQKINASGLTSFELFGRSEKHPFKDHNMPSSSVVDPACHDSAFVVGATGLSKDELASYSSRGPTNRGQVKPDVTAPTEVSTVIRGPFPGTSSSCPHVAGAAALILSQNPYLKPYQVQGYLENSAKDLDAPGKDNRTGWGRIKLVSANLLAPNGGEKLTPGTNYRIQWSTLGSGVAQVQLVFSTNDGKTWTAIPASVLNSGQYLWPVPDLSSAACRIRVIAQDANGRGLAEDISDAPFTIGRIEGPGTNVGGTISQNTTWTRSQSPYVVINDVTIAQGITLTVEPGVTVKFNQTCDIYVNGALIANGTPSNKIIFTANSATPSPGYWGGIKFNNSNIAHLSVLNHCQFLYGGQGFYSEFAPIALDARANPTISNVTLINNLRTGIHLAEGTYNSNILLNDAGIPYFIINDDLRIGSGYTMTIKPGVIIKFGNVLDLYINGALVANGTASQPIIFTSFADDAHGGDTNGDGATFPSPGSWGGIRFNNSNIGSSSVLNYCEFYYGGQEFYQSEASPITVDGRVNPRITNTTLRNNGRNGIRLAEGTYYSPILLDVVGIPYFLLSDDVVIAQGVKMTIKPGVIVKFAGERDLYINGALNAKGTASQPIIFTSMRDDAHGGDTNGDGSTLPAAGNWGGVRYNDSNIDSLSALSFCEFYYGGQGFYSEASPLSIDPRVNPVISNLTFQNNTRNGIRLLEGTYNTNLLLDVVGTPYFFSDDIVVGQDIKMVINAGVTIKFERERDIYVRGALIANATASQPIIFTSMNDDAHGGDTNNDGLTFPAAGYWGGVRLEKSNVDHLSVLNYCIPSVNPVLHRGVK
ncbi:MAG: S8 family serine peptidase [Candidatus Nitrosotenuis sp.]